MHSLLAINPVRVAFNTRASSILQNRAYGCLRTLPSFPHNTVKSTGRLNALSPASIRAASTFNLSKSSAFARSEAPKSHSWGRAAFMGTVGLGLAAGTLWRSPVYCSSSPPPETPDSFPQIPSAEKSVPPPGPPPKSSVSMMELSFGTVAGICAGVFVKKGAKLVAFFLGGVFVLLQYLTSAQMVRVDWAKVSNRFESRFHTTTATGESRAPTVYSLWTWLVDFLTADFPPRATFLAGFALGLRLG